MKAYVIGNIAAAILLLPGLCPAQQHRDVRPDTAYLKKEPSQRPYHLTLDSVLHQALAANPSLKALGHQARAAEDEATAVARTRWGELNGLAKYQRLNDDQILRPISKQLLKNGMAGLPFHDKQLHYGLSYDVPLYLGGKLTNRIKIARLESQKTAALLKGTRWQVRFNAASLYLAAQGLDAVIRAQDEQIKALETTEKRLALMVKAGKRPELDRLKIVEELEDARSQKSELVAGRIRVGSLLLSLLGRNPSAGVIVDPPGNRLPRLGVSPAVLQADIDQTAVIQQARLGLEQAGSSIKIARSDFIPKLLAHGSYLQNKGLSASNTDSDRDTWELSLDLQVPLFAGGSRFKRLTAAREKQLAAEQALRETRLKIAAELEDALAQFDAAGARLKAAVSRVAAGNEAARIEKIRYETGADTVEDLLRALSRQQAARAALARARAELATTGQRINSIVEKEEVQ